ncbi:hypothetical protein [uncultured Algimonas sp.]|uniref:hypothetical protein n=1 Tax=uncultured Algimonas sp. TaxID=1547920 RepID=UPI0026215C7E|nr:hypothetical protein [uncultured Algimonas sp.]
MKKLSSALMAATLLSACSTIDRGTNDHVRVDSVPQGAQVTVTTLNRVDRQGRKVSGTKGYLHDNQTLVCRATPCAIEVPRRTDMVVRVEADGFEPVEYYVGPSKLRGGVGTSVVKTAAASAATGVAVGTITTFGIIAVQQMVSGFFSALTLSATPTVGASGATAAGTGVGLGVAAASLLVDAGTGANLNLFPNPAVLGLAPKGTTVIEDDMATAFWNLTRAQNNMAEACHRNRSKPDCETAKRAMELSETTFKSRKKEMEDFIIETAKAARDEARKG